MRKLLPIAATGATFLVSAVTVFAQTAITGTKVPITQPIGSITGLCLTKVPQFIIQLLFVVGIVISIAFLIYGGIKWVLSGGDKTGVETARNHIIAAVIGLIIVIGAFFIVGLVFQLVGAENPVLNLQITDLQGQLIKCP